MLTSWLWHSEVKPPDLWTPVALLPRPQGSSLHLILYVVPILKWGTEEIFTHFRITHNLYKRELDIPGAPANIPHWIWSLPSPSLIFGFHGNHGTTRLCPVSLPPGESQMTNRPPTCLQALKAMWGAWIFIPGNIIKVLLLF